MSRYRFVQPETARLPLSDGDFIDVKRELNARETRRVFSRMVKNGVILQGQDVGIDPDQVGFAKLHEYVIGWSFTDQKGVPVPVSEDAIGNLDHETLKEMIEAVDAHEKAIETEKNKTGETPAAPISSSLA